VQQLKTLGRRVTMALAGAGMTACLAAPSALAAGGPDIASGATVQPGQQMFGDTSAGNLHECSPADYWNLPLLAGDKATVDWASLTDTHGTDYAVYLDLYDAGTTDFSINNAEPIEEYRIGSNHRAESVFAAGRAGTYPLIFWMNGENKNCEGNDTGGPFNFTVYVAHAVVPALGSVKGLADRRGSVTLGAHRPDGQPITDQALRLTLMAAWRGHKSQPVASASPTNGTATVGVHLPKSAAGRKVTFRAAAAGTGYRSARSAARKLRIRK
jgi:hypothetical protein